MTSPDDVKTKVVTFLTAAFDPDDEGGYQSTIEDMMRATYNNADQQLEFKTKTAELQAYLIGKNFPVLSPTIMTHVPESAVPEFYIAPWQLSFDPSVSVKGSWGIVCHVSLSVRQARLLFPSELTFVVPSPL